MAKIFHFSFAITNDTSKATKPKERIITPKTKAEIGFYYCPTNLISYKCVLDGTVLIYMKRFYAQLNDLIAL